MYSLLNIWKKNNEKPGVKVHYIDWQMTPKYFEIKAYNTKDNSFTGVLDNGETAKYSNDNSFWEVYDESKDYLMPKIA